MALGAAAHHLWVNHRRPSKDTTPAAKNEADPTAALEIVGRAIDGALSAANLYVGDRLKLYEALRRLCGAQGERSTNAVELSRETLLNRRYLREWLAQQAALGVLVLEDGEGDGDEDLRYRLPQGCGEVLANPNSKCYLIPMVQAMPALVARAKTMLLEAFKTGVGMPYDEPDVCEALDRAHAGHIRTVVVPKLLPKTGVRELLSKPAATCADLGCGGGNFVIALAREFPDGKFYGYEVSDAALGFAAASVRAARLANAVICDARETPLGAVADKFDVVTTFDVLHDATDPVDLMRQVKRALKPDGVWLLADLQVCDTTRANVKQTAGASTLFAFSTCLCLACGTSTKQGLGLGTTGFSTTVAKRMLDEVGFSQVRVVLEEEGTRWFEVRH